MTSRSVKLTKRRNARLSAKKQALKSGFWDVVHVQESRHKQRMRRTLNDSIRRAEKKRHPPFDKHARYERRRMVITREEILKSQRRSILIHTDGAFSPVKMLPWTTHPHGVIGSFMGGRVQMLACHVDTGVVLMGRQDSVCDEPWSDEAYELIKELKLVKNVDVIYGMALCVRLVPSSAGPIILGDLPLYDDRHVDCTRQKEALYSAQDMDVVNGDDDSAKA